MPRTVTIYSPCDVVGVRVFYRDGKYVSPVELTVLEAIAEGQRGTEQIAALLSLNERIVLDVVSDLWRRGYVVLDFGRGEVRLSDAAAAHAASGTLDQLAGIERGGSIVKIMYDRLSGHVLPRSGLRTPADFRLAVPVEGSGDSIEDASPAQLLAAVQRSVDDGQDGLGLRKEVVSAHLSPVELREPTGRTWLPLDVRVGHDDATNRLRVSVVGTDLPLARRQQAAERLARLAEEYPTHRFVYALRSQVDPEYADPLPLEELASRLTQAAAEADSARPGTRRQFHRRLRQQVAQVADELADRAASEVHATALYDRAALRETARELAGYARSQIVLVAPTIRLNGLHDLLEPLMAARNIGAQIVVIWGRGQDETLDNDVRSALYQLARRTPATGPAPESGGAPPAMQVLWSARPARVNVCAVVCDDRSALVTNDALFGSSGTGAPLQFGVRVDAPRPGRCQPIERILDWASHAIPEYRLGAAIYRRHERFHPAATPGADGSGADPDLTADELRAAVLAEIPGEPQEADDEVGTAAMAAWSHRWSQAAARIQELIGARTLPWARLIEDGAHTDLLWHALADATSRLVIGTRDVDPSALTNQLVSALQGCADRKVAVTVVSDARGGESLDALAALSGNDHIQLTKRGSGARFLVVDNQVAAGSYGYLSAGGRFGVGRRRPRSDLSLLVTAPAIADQVAARFTASEGMDDPQAGLTLAPAPSAWPAADETVLGPFVQTAQRLLDRLRDASTQRAGLAAVRDMLAAEANPWPVIGYLRDNGAPGEIVRVAIASSWDRSGADADVARIWLVQDLWRSGQFAEAAILRDDVPGDHLRPRRALAEVAAAAGTEASAEALQAAALSSPSEAEAVAIAVVGAAELLLGSGSDTEGPAGWDGERSPRRSA